jgi:hypothetical protein
MGFQLGGQAVDVGHAVFLEGLQVAVERLQVIE